jgi:hypothetical protein
MNEIKTIPKNLYYENTLIRVKNAIEVIDKYLGKGD